MFLLWWEKLTDPLRVEIWFKLWLLHNFSLRAHKYIRTPNHYNQPGFDLNQDLFLLFHVIDYPFYIESQKRYKT